MASFTQPDADTVVLESEAGEFTILTTVQQAGQQRAGPGYVARWTSPKGDRIVDGLTTGFVSANDPAIGGLAVPAWHHFRANGEADIWRRGWEINPLRPAPAGVSAARVLDGPRVDRNGNVRMSIETEFADIYEPVMSVRHDYIAEARNLRVWVTFNQRWGGDGFPAFLKEPKLSLGFGTAFKSLELYDSSEQQLLTADLTKLLNPAKHTIQLRAPTRARVRFLPADVNVVASAAGRNQVDGQGRVTRYGARTAWLGSRTGLDAWAQAANARAEFEQGNTRPYCLQGPNATLSRNWEVAKRDEAPASLMLHAWEGGYGLPDCLACARAFRSGESWSAYVCVSLGRGWRY